MSTALTKRSDHELIRRFQKKGCKKSRNIVAERYSNIPVRVAASLIKGRKRVGENELENLQQIGHIALLERAIPRFDESKGAFKTYAYGCVWSVMMDHFRSFWFGSKFANDQRKMVYGIYWTLKQNLVREPSEHEIISELTKHLECERKEAERLFDKYGPNTAISVYDEQAAGTNNGDEGNVTLLDIQVDSASSPIKVAEDRERLAAVKAAIRDAPLSRDERATIRMYYFGHMLCKEIGLSLRVTESRVGQMHKRALEKIMPFLESAYGAAT